MVRYAAWLVALLLAAGCADHPTRSPGASPMSSSTGSPVESTSPAGSAGRPVGLTTSDGARLIGTVRGTGSTVVVLVNMGDNDVTRWDPLAVRLAEAGYQVLAFSYRYPVDTGDFTAETADQALVDTRAAVDLAARRGDRVVLVGASLGGMMAARLGGAAHARALVVVASPARLPGYDFAVTPDELASLTMPKLFVSSRSDDTVPFSSFRSLVRAAPPPSRLRTFPGTSHALGLLEGPDADRFTESVLSFLTGAAPPG